MKLWNEILKTPNPFVEGAFAKGKLKVVDRDDVAVPDAKIWGFGK